ncbi:hypothetical protein ACFFRR_001298 [Megaselia abdita]
MPVGNDTFAVLDNPYPYLASDRDRKELILLNKDQMQKCIVVGKRTFLCKHSFASYTDRSKNCIKEMMVHDNDQTISPIKGFKTQGELWEALASDNQWLYVVPPKTSIVRMIYQL